MTGSTTDVNLRPSTPWWFWVISGLALIWNLLGVIAFVMQLSMSPEDVVAAYGQEQADLITSQPTWYIIAFGAAVFGAALGCILLLLRKRAAIWPLLISLIAVIIQNIYFIMSGFLDQVHAGQKVMTLMIPGIALFLVWFSHRMTKRGILT